VNKSCAHDPVASKIKHPSFAALFVSRRVSADDSTIRFEDLPQTEYHGNPYTFTVAEPRQTGYFVLRWTPNQASSNFVKAVPNVGSKVGK
jgi:hypothetical protein